jgi:E3 ubiquitin-protein ligase HERC2
VTTVSCGYEHSLALTSTGDIYSWGQGEGGLLGHGDYETQSVPQKVKFFSKKKVEKAVCGGLHNLAIT